MSGGGRYRLTRADLVEHLRDQIAFLHASAKAFDAGSEGEAKRLATVLRVLLHDTSRSASLLGQLGLKEKISYVDTASPINPRNLLATPGLVMMQMSSEEGGSYIAPLDNLSPERVQPNKPFPDWWEQPVTKDSGGNLFSRKDYVLTASNKEGGAHVDHSLDAAYADLTKNNALGCVYSTGAGPEQPMDRNPAFASVRQIAYEVEQTFKQHPLKLGLS